MASYGGHKDVMKTLIGEGADVNVETNVSRLGVFCITAGISLIMM